MDRDAIIRRGIGAEKILTDENVMKAFGDLEAELFTEWSGTNPTDSLGREAIFFQVKAIELFQTKLESWSASGKLETSNAERDLQDAKGITDSP